MSFRLTTCIVPTNGDAYPVSFCPIIKMEFPKRKLQRLSLYDYSQNGLYFITICTQNMICLFGNIRDSQMTLNSAGAMIHEEFLNTAAIYNNITVEKFIVMPNHLHSILVIDNDKVMSEVGTSKNGTTRRSFPTSISEFVQRFKSYTTHLYIEGVKNSIYAPFNQKIWEKSFHDHIIRDEVDYSNHWNYIDQNPAKWQEDKYFNRT